MRGVGARANLVTSFMSRLPYVGTILMGFLALGVGAHFVFGGRMTLGELVAFHTLFGQLTLFVRQVAKNRTVLMVTHRLAPAAHCDRVFVLDQGKVIEEGNLSIVRPGPAAHVFTSRSSWVRRA